MSTASMLELRRLCRKCETLDETWRELDLSGEALGDAGVTVLASSPLVAGLLSLSLGRCGIGVEGVRALAASPHLAGLKILSLAGNDIRDDGVVALAASPNLVQLTSLSLGENPITSRGAHALAASPHLGRLTTLDLHGTEIGAEGLVALLTSPCLRALCTLRFQVMDTSVPVGAEGTRRLLASAHAPPLEHLDASRWSLGDEGAAALAQWPGLSALRTLLLSHNAIGDVGLAALAASPSLRALRTLDLSNNVIGDVGLNALARATGLTCLENLKLRENTIGAEGALALAASSTLSAVVSLDLSRNRLGARGASALAASAHMDRLEELDLGCNSLGDEGALALAQTARASALRSLFLNENAITEEGAEALVTSKSLARVSWIRLFHNPVAAPLMSIRRENHHSAETDALLEHYALIDTMDLGTAIAAFQTAPIRVLNYLTSHALRLCDYPMSGPVPLCAELTPAQRRVMEATTNRSGIGFAPGAAVPLPVQVRRRWLGIDPPSVLERVVTLRRDGAVVRWPYWKAWCELAHCEQDDERRALLPSPVDQFEAAILIQAWGPRLYGFDAKDEATLNRRDLGEVGARRAVTLLDELLAFHRVIVEGDPPVEVCRLVQPDPEGRARFDRPNPIGDEVWGALVGAIVVSGRRIEARWEPILPFAHPYVTEWLAGIEASRRDEALLASFRRASLYMGLRTALSLLRTVPAALLAEEVACTLESQTFLAEHGSETVAGWAKAWNQLAAVAPPRVWRPLRPAPASSPPAQK